MRRAVISVGLLIVVAAAFLLSIHGTAPYPYREEQLAQVFMAKAEEQGLVLADEAEPIQQAYGNSVTFLMQDEEGVYAWATYVATPLTGEYKEFAFYTQERAQAEPFVYTVNDGLMQYQVCITYGETIQIDSGAEAESVVTWKICAMSLAILLIMANLLMRGKNKGKFEVDNRK